jgi:hypothetical protein
VSIGALITRYRLVRTDLALFLGDFFIFDQAIDRYA